MNNLKFAIRGVIKNKLHSFLNIFGLAIGIAVFLTIILFVQSELSYDKFHKHANSICRVTKRYDAPNGYNLHFARVPDTWVNNLPDEYPEIETLIRFQQTPITEMKIGDHKFRDRHF